jgi:hypothetical protein
VHRHNHGKKTNEVWQAAAEEISLVQKTFVQQRRACQLGIGRNASERKVESASRDGRIQENRVIEHQRNQ